MVVRVAHTAAVGFLATLYLQQQHTMEHMGARAGGRGSALELELVALPLLAPLVLRRDKHERRRHPRGYDQRAAIQEHGACGTTRAREHVHFEHVHF